MEHYKTEVVPETTKKVLESTTCDICKKDVEETEFERDEVEITRNITEMSYPECGNGVKTTVDMCGGCFQEKFLPWLWGESGGAEIKEKKWDY